MLSIAKQPDLNGDGRQAIPSSLESPITRYSGTKTPNDGRK